MRNTTTPAAAGSRNCREDHRLLALLGEKPMNLPHPCSAVSGSAARRWLWAGALLAVLAALFVVAAIPAGRGIPALEANALAAQRFAAPDFTGGVGWLNTAKPISIKSLRGKIVLLDFWTLCCINCIHIMPDLAKLEKKYAKELVVIGVHSAKFENEKNTESIKKAVLRYEIKHPVVNDANMKIWQAYEANSWPTLILIDPEGNIVGKTSGEGNYEVLDKAIASLIEIHKKKKTLIEKSMDFELVKEQAGPLFFPGKVLADAASNRLFIADSTHHRIVITDLNGKKIAIAGTGTPHAADGSFEQAGFNDPQGMALKGDILYVADRKNHLIRQLDLKAQSVKTIAGIGEQGNDRQDGGEALKTGLNSPWDLLLVGNDLYIAMAGHHQIWVMDLAKGNVRPYAGDGYENIRDDSLPRSRFAQPSGLATDGKYLYVADSEISAIRKVPLGGKGFVSTIVGRGLFEFGDRDGEGNDVRLQHALGVAYVDGKLYVADTYNSKLKVIDPEKRSCQTFLGGGKEETFNEPAGLSFANGKLYVADTNAHRIRVVDLKSKAVTTLALSGVEAPKK
jgi:thiol-disulfide isomerase/thioredoxin/sugar lactone lactonase YvrE